MNVVVVSNSPLPEINELFQVYQVESSYIKPQDINKVQGQIGDFTLSTSLGEIRAHAVVINGEYAVSPWPQGLLTQCQAKSLVRTYHDKQFSTNKTIVLLLDYLDESPEILTKLALEKAIRLARKRKTVFYLAKFVRTGPGLEGLYKEARNSGVVFINYSAIEHDGERLVVRDEYQSFSAVSPEVIAGDQFIPGAEMLRLAKLFNIQTSLQGFIEANKHFLYPVMTSRRGVYILDRLRVLPSSVMDYLVAEVVAEASSPNNLVHAEIDGDKCAYCYTCYRACPHAAMTPDYENSIMANLPQACYGCGICAGICPANAIEIVGEPKEIEQANALQLFACENSAEIAFSKVQHQLAGIEKVQLTSLSCGGEVSVEQILTALKNHEKVVVATCIDDACKHFNGNKRACQYVTKVKEMLQAAGVNPERVDFIKVSQGMPLILSSFLEEALA